MQLCLTNLTNENLTYQDLYFLIFNLNKPYIFFVLFHVRLLVLNSEQMLTNFNEPAEDCNNLDSIYAVFTSEHVDTWP